MGVTPLDPGFQILPAASEAPGWTATEGSRAHPQEPGPPLLVSASGGPWIQASASPGHITAPLDRQGQLVAAGLRGPKGDPGALGEATVRLPAGQILGGHRLVYFTGTVLLYAESEDPFKVEVLGLTTHAALAGELVEVRRLGLLTESTWNWQPGPVFLGQTGLLSQIAPESGAVVQVGYAVDATTLDLRIASPIFLE